MKGINKAQYEYALQRIEELLPLVTDETPATDSKAIELTLMSDVVIEYEKEHYPIEKPTVAELIKDSLKEKRMTQKELSENIGISPSRISEYVSGKALPPLNVAGKICRILNIQPAVMLGI